MKCSQGVSFKWLRNIDRWNHIRQYVVDVNTPLFLIKSRHESIKRQQQDRKTTDQSGKTPKNDYYQLRYPKRCPEHVQSPNGSNSQCKIVKGAEHFHDARFCIILL